MKDYKLDIALEINCPECDKPQKGFIETVIPIKNHSINSCGRTWREANYGNGTTKFTCGCVVPYLLFKAYMEAYTNKLNELGFYE